MGRPVAGVLHRHFDPAFSRVVVGYDGSARAGEAVRQAVAIAGGTGAEVQVVHVVDPALASLSPRRRGAEVRTIADEILAEGVRLAGGAGETVSGALLVGAPAPLLVDHAFKHWADLICVGADSGFLEDGRILGRVAFHTLRDARCSVLVARPTSDSESFPRRIVCAVDRTPMSMEAARAAAILARAASAELTFVHAVDVHGGGSGPGWVTEEGGDDPGPLSVAAKVASAEGLKAARRVALGRPGPALVRGAEEYDADLLVAGSRGIRGMQRALAGSVGEWLVNHAACSVLVVRPRDRGPR